MNTKLLVTFVSAIFIALCWGVAFMYFFGDIISYYMGPLDKGIPFYAIGGGTTVALTFMLAIDIVLFAWYFRRMRLITAHVNTVKKDWSEKNVYQKSDV